MIRLFPALAVLIMLGPVIAGLTGTALPALGFLPALGGDAFGLAPLLSLIEQPGILRSALLSLWTGLAATGLSLMLALGFVAAVFGTRLMATIGRLLSPLLSVPHAALALGLAFLLAPSGWLVRLLSPWATGWSWPPDLLIVNDPGGVSLILGLTLKETPFLFLMILAGLERLDADRFHRAARSLGQAPMTAWLKVILPRLYPRLRLPLLAVLAFSVSVVDMAIILGPTTPAPLAVRVVDWANDPDLERRFLAAAGAMAQLGLTAVAILIWLGAERLTVRLARPWLSAGSVGDWEQAARWVFIAATTTALAAAVLSLLGLVIWSVADVWRFPDAWPSDWTLTTWSSADLAGPLFVTLVAALVSATVATLVTVGCLEAETRSGRPAGRRATTLLYLPLLVPQVAFLFGLQVLLVVLALDGTWPALIWAHLIFVLPYVFLSLAGPWRRQDARWVTVARVLGRSSNAALLQVTLPMLARPLLTAFAVGVSVSVAQYLPTVFAGAGRLTTLTTEAVAMSAGGDRRIIGVYGLLQMALPLLAFLLAQTLPGPLVRLLGRTGMAASRPARG